MKRKIGKLCVITDTVVQQNYSHIEIVRMAISGGADIIQFRDKYMPTGDMIKAAKKMKNICKDSGVMFIVNDRVDIALISEADGVHLGNHDIPVKEARKLLGRNKIIGGTAHSLKEALFAQEQGADYLGFGHIFQTASKYKDTPPVGLSELKRVVNAIRIPVFAIGGIGIDNVEYVMKTGVYGIAVIGSVVKSKNPEREVKDLRRIIYAKRH